MSCILRISGEELNIDEMLQLNSLTYDQVWRKEEPCSITGKLNISSGIQFVVSDADFESFIIQRSDAIKFLEKNMDAILKMVQFPNVQDKILDFGVSITEGNVSVMSYLSPELVDLAAKCALGVEISCYLCSDDE
ncbi:MAG: hypothetical protein V3U88_07805 [Methylococcales bacterium]